MFLRVCIHPVLTEGINLPFLLSCSHSLFINLCLPLHHKLLPRKCWTSELKIYYTFFFFSPQCPLKSSQFWHFLSQSINIFRNATSTDSHSLIYRFSWNVLHHKAKMIWRCIYFPYILLRFFVLPLSGNILVNFRNF